jgi:chromate reductase, NAD(P)H dehydrogenase (quinone)
MAVRILGISGSLRRASMNTGLLRAAAQVAPAGVVVELFDLRPLPFYDADLEQAGTPEPVLAFRDAIERAEALLIATPEYNYSVTGVLKNALDWASRPDFGAPTPGPSPLTGKPMAMMGAGGGFGTIRAQMHLRQMALHNDMKVLVKPEVGLQRVREKFDADGNLLDDTIREQVRGLLEALLVWAARLR